MAYKRTLYEPVPDYEKGIGSSYRWLDLWHLTDPAYNICPEAIGQLARTSPELLNINKRNLLSGMTILLNQFLNVSVTHPKRMQVIKMLATPININLQNSLGNTSLHTFFIMRLPIKMV